MNNKTVITVLLQRPAWIARASPGIWIGGIGGVTVIIITSLTMYFSKKYWVISVIHCIVPRCTYLRLAFCPNPGWVMSIPLGSCLKPKKWRVTVTDTLQTYIPIWRNYSKWPVGHVRRRVLTLMHSNFGPVGKWQVFSSGAQCVNYVLLVRSEAEKMVLEPAWVSSFFFY